MAEPSLRELLEVATEAALVGGKRTLDYFNAGVAVELKADRTPVTRADRESEELIRKVIGKQYPSHAILGEEQGETAGTAPYRWIVDPLDGTKSFVHGVPLYGTLIGLEVRGEPVVGVIYLPALNELLAAASGEGCRWNDRPARVSSVADLSEALVCCSDERHARDRSSAYLALAQRTRLQRTWGDCYAYVLVATGRAEVALDPMMNLWDCAALAPIIREAGGHFTDWKGQATIHSNEAVATNAALHAAVIEVLREG